MADQDLDGNWLPDVTAGWDVPPAPRPGVRAPRPGPARRGSLRVPAAPGSPDPDPGLAEPFSLTAPQGAAALPEPAPAPRPLPVQVPAVPVPARPAAAPDPGPSGLLDPRLSARRFADLLADADRARAERAARLAEGRAETLARAGRYRDAAGDIRDQTQEAWRQVASSLAEFGVDELSQVRAQAPEPEDGAAPVSLAKGGAARPALGQDSRRGGTRPQRRRGAPVLPADPDAVPDLVAELDEARQQCLRAIAVAAELRGVQKAEKSLSAGLVTAGVCALVAVLATVTRIFLGTASAQVVLGALVVGAAVVSVAGGGAKAAVRAALLAAGTAGAVSLGTLHYVHAEPVGMLLSLASLAAAIRFGLGFGAPKPPPEKPAPRPRPARWR